MPTGGIDLIAGAGALEGFLGADAAAIIGTGLAGAELGGGIGGLESAITGQPIGQGVLHGAEAGALTGGGIGIGGDIAAGLGATAGSTGAILGGGLGGAAGGGLGAAATGGNPVMGALEGGLSGGISGSGILNSSTAASSPDAATGAATGAPTNATSAGAGGGGAPGGVAAPSGLTPDSGDTLFNTQNLGVNTNLGNPSQTFNTGTPLSSVANADVGSSLTSSGNVGSGTVGTQGLSSGTERFLQNGANNAPIGTESLSPSVINDSNAATPSGPDPALNQQGFLSRNLGGTDPVEQTLGQPSSLASASSVAGGGGVKTPNSIGQFISDPSLGNLGNALGSNIGALASAGGIGLDALKGNKQTGAEKNIEAQAAQQGQQGQQLEQYLQTGTLPAGEQQNITQQLNSAIASIKSRYASMGMSGSSAEAQDIANAQAQAEAAGAQQGMQLLNIGIGETGMSSQLYDQMVKNQMASDTSLSSAINNFASVAGGGGLNSRGGVNITYSGQQG